MSIKSTEFETIICLPIHERIFHYSVCSVYKYFAQRCPDYFEELYFPAESSRVSTRSSYQKLKLPRRTTHIGLKALSYTDPSICNSLKNATNLNTFKHDIKNHYFDELRKTESYLKFLK